MVPHLSKIFLLIRAGFGLVSGWFQSFGGKSLSKRHLNYFFGWVRPFGWVRVGLCGFGWVRVVSCGFGWFRVVGSACSAGFSWVRVVPAFSITDPALHSYTKSLYQI